MKPTTLELIKNVLATDDTVTPAETKRILDCCRGARTDKRTLIGAKETQRVLSISKPTLLSWVKQGKLTQIRFSSRLVRYDAEEVRTLANNGV